LSNTDCRDEPDWAVTFADRPIGGVTPQAPAIPTPGVSVYRLRL